jgi:hypothetical protein
MPKPNRIGFCIMGMTLLEARKLARTQLEAAVIDEFIESELLTIFPFRNIVGGGLPYGTVGALPGIGFRGVNEDYAESTGIINPQFEPTKIFGGNMDVDQYIVDTEGEGARATHVRLKLEAARLNFERVFIKGDSVANPREVDGLQNRVTGNQLIANSPTGGALSMSQLDRTIDRVRGGGSGRRYLFCHSQVKRRMEQYLRESGNGGLTYTYDEAGREITDYRGTRIIVLEDDNLGNDILPFTEASSDGSTLINTSIYVAKFGDQLCTGIQSPVTGRFGLQADDLGLMQTQSLYRIRVNWYVGIAILNGRAVSRLSGIQDLPAVA